MTTSTRKFRLLRRRSEVPPLPRGSAGAAAEIAPTHPAEHQPVGTIDETIDGQLWEVRTYGLNGTRWEPITPTKLATYLDVLHSYTVFIAATFIGSTLSIYSAPWAGRPISIALAVTLLATAVTGMYLKQHWRRHHIAEDPFGRLLGHPRNASSAHRAIEAADRIDPRRNEPQI